MMSNSWVGWASPCRASAASDPLSPQRPVSAGIIVAKYLTNEIYCPIEDTADLPTPPERLACIWTSGKNFATIGSQKCGVIGLIKPAE